MSQGPGEGVRYMNRATCGLENSDSPSSDNVAPQETTTQETGTVGANEAGLSSPGGSVVAESRSESTNFEELSSHAIHTTIPGGIPPGDPEEPD
jgi:hypothetical protein